MYPSGTILQLREPQSTDEVPYPYDRVEVIGQSPVQHVTPGGDGPWAGADAFGWIIRPAGEHFGPTVDKPLGQINELYDVESYPVDEVTGVQLKPESAQRGPQSPEQVFAANAREHQAEVRKRADSFQHDGKTPEQVLREAAPKPQPRGRRQQKDKADA